MIGIVLVTHGQLAREFRLAVEHVVGPQAAMETIAVLAEAFWDILVKEVPITAHGFAKAQGWDLPFLDEEKLTRATSGWGREDEPELDFGGAAHV